MLLGTNLTYTKAYNYRIVFETIRLFGPISRADIARRSNLTAQTVSNIVKRLLDTGLIFEGTKRQDGRGAPSITLQVNPHGSYSVGLDFNRDHLTAVLVDLSGKVKQRLYTELDSPDPRETIDLMSSKTFQLLEKQKISVKQLGGVGISFPGSMKTSDDKNKVSWVHPTAFASWGNVPVVDMLSKHIDVPIFLENNASAAALGERWYGDGQHVSSFLYLFLGAGLGSGLILNGHLYDGHTGNAGEIGYIPFPGGIGLLSNSSQAHIGEHFNLSRLYKWLNSFNANVSRPSDLVELYNNNHVHLHDWLSVSKQILTPTLLTIEYLLDPEVIFIGGRLPAPIIHNICDGLNELVPERRIASKNFGPKLQYATAGEDAAALGAATLPMYDLFAPQPQVLIKRDAVQI